MRDRTTDELLKDAKEALKLCEMCLPVFTDVPGFTHRKEGKDTYVNLAELIAELSAKLRESEEKQIYHHYKGGKYELVGFGITAKDHESVVMYKSIGTDKVWVRPEWEFHKKFSVYPSTTPPKKED